MYPYFYHLIAVSWANITFIKYCLTLFIYYNIRSINHKINKNINIIYEYNNFKKYIDNGNSNNIDDSNNKSYCVSCVLDKLNKLS